MTVRWRCSLVGAGGHAREIAAQAQDNDRLAMIEKIYSEMPEDVGREFPFPRLRVERLPDSPDSDTNYILAIGNPGARRRLWDCGFQSETAIFLLRPGVGFSGRYSPGCVVLFPTFMGPDVMLGFNVHVLPGAQLHHDVRIDAHAFIGPGAILCGSVCVGEGAFIGAGAVILPGVKIGRDVVIGAGSVVTKDVLEADHPIVGVPGREMR